MFPQVFHWQIFKFAKVSLSHVSFSTQSFIKTHDGEWETTWHRMTHFLQICLMDLVKNIYLFFESLKLLKGLLVFGIFNFPDSFFFKLLVNLFSYIAVPER